MLLYQYINLFFGEDLEYYCPLRYKLNFKVSLIGFPDKKSQSIKKFRQDFATSLYFLRPQYW